MIFNLSCSFLNILYIAGLLTQHEENRDRLVSNFSQSISFMEIHLNILAGKNACQEEGKGIQSSIPLPGSVSGD